MTHESIDQKLHSTQIVSLTSPSPHSTRVLLTVSSTDCVLRVEVEPSPLTLTENIYIHPLVHILELIVGHQLMQCMYMLSVNNHHL